MIKKWLWKIISGIIGSIQTVLLVLKFFGYINYSWLIVFSPIFIIAIAALIYYIIKLIFRRKK